MKFKIMLADESEPTSIEIKDTNAVTSESHVKLLGIYLDNKLNFTKQIGEIIRKSSRQLNCLKRVAHSLSTDIKLMPYKSFVGSNFNYCPLVWHHCGASNTVKLEKLQFRALKFIYNDYASDYDALLTKATMPSLEVSRLRTFAIEVFKIYDLSPAFLKDGFIQPENRYNLRSGCTLLQRHLNTTKYGLHSFRTCGIKIWNNLPAAMRNNTELKTFKIQINTWFGFSCKFNFCRSQVNI